MFSTPGREEMFNREEMDWNIYQYYDVKMFRPDSSEGFLQPSSSLAALNDSEDIMKTMIKRERNRVAATKCRYRHEVNPIFLTKKNLYSNLNLNILSNFYKTFNIANEYMYMYPQKSLIFITLERRRKRSCRVYCTQQSSWRRATRV